MNNRLFILIFIAAIFIVGGFLYIYNPQPVEYRNSKIIEPVVCATDEKLCPNGTYVGRIPPSCKFEECKNIPDGAVFEDGTIMKTASSSDTASSTTQ